jgi:mRNA interferase MazF
VPFPFTDLSAVKQRPALVLSPDRLNKVRTDLVVAAITSQVPAALGEDEILLSANELDAAGLPKVSLIKLGKIFTIHQGMRLAKMKIIRSVFQSDRVDYASRKSGGWADKKRLRIYDAPSAKSCRSANGRGSSSRSIKAAHES